MKNWLNNKIIEKEIDGVVVKFRRVPIGTLQKFRTINEDVAKALAMLFKDTSHDVEIDQMSTPSESVDGEGTPFMNTGYKQSAAQASIISLRKTQLEEGIKGIINALTRDESFEILCEVVAKSAWEEFDGVDVARIKEEVDTVTLIEFLKGAFEASAGDYAKLGKSWFQKNPKVAELLETVTK